jgi:aminopeptidase N
MPKCLYVRCYRVILLVFIIFSLSCNKKNPEYLLNGVSVQLAKLREKQITNLRYFTSFNVPDSIHKQVTGYEIIEFNFNKDLKEPLILDFRNPESFIESVQINSKDIKYNFENEHIIIPYSKLINGKNQIDIKFISGNRALNRNKEYLYTLFVPDKACSVFPCFDQPSLKAKFRTEITIPNDWIAIANSPLTDQKSDKNNRRTFIFDESEPISTYMYSFVAGKFKSVSRTYSDTIITMYHRENDVSKLNYNIDNLFDLQYSSLKWLEKYTQINYPFKKLDFIVIPSFQYSGMEHPGAILYRDSKLFLENNSTVREKLDRANLIAHETAHMWFGNLVTMEWFSEVWLKEVFANFIAGKIVNPQYPDFNHDLNFIISHYPSSYSVDRTIGANSIEQSLDNLKNAGSLYGDIIYHKAPIVMKQLENIVGEEILQSGLQDYLSRNKYKNAGWNDLISILDSNVSFDLKSWSNSWVYESGMPNYEVLKAYNEENILQSIIITQSDPKNEGIQWSQELEMIVAENNKYKTYNIELKDTFTVIELELSSTTPNYIFPNSNGFGYGYFKLDSSSINSIANKLKNIKDPVLRCSMYISLWENMLNQNIKPEKLFNTYIECLKTETNPQNVDLVLENIESIFWRFLKKNERNLLAPNLENFLWEKVNSVNSISKKASFFNSFKKLVITTSSVNLLYQIWNKEIAIPGLDFSINDFTNMAFELAIRDFDNIDDILNEQYNNLKNTERKERFLFIKPALSANINDRDSFFEELKNEKNREKELWIIDGLHYLHHPLRSAESVKYIIPSLKILEELQITGDIFFPKKWLDATFNGHSSIDAVLDINLYLNEYPDLPINLKNKVLQSADQVFRSSIIKKE